MKTNSMDTHTQRVEMVLSLRPTLDPVLWLGRPASPQHLSLPIKTTREISLVGGLDHLWHRPMWLWPQPYLLPLGSQGKTPGPERLHGGWIFARGEDRQRIPPADWNYCFAFPRHKRYTITSVLIDHQGQRIVSVQGIGYLPESSVEKRNSSPLNIRFSALHGTLRLGSMHLRLHRGMWIRSIIQPASAPNGPEAQRIRFAVIHPQFGPVFGYEGLFRPQPKPSRVPALVTLQSS